MLHQFFAQHLRGFNTSHECDISINTLTFNIMWKTDHSSLSHCIMQNQRALHFGRAHAMTRDIDNIINPAGDPIIAILVPACAITGKIFTWEHLEIGINKALMITVDCAHLPGPGPFDTKCPFSYTLKFIAFIVDYAWLNTKKWHCGCTRF